MKRLRAPKLNDGDLMVYWGKLPHDCPDVIFAWQGDASMKRDSALLYYHFACQQPGTSAAQNFSEMKPSLIQELESRGYDITTLKFSIKKKTPNA